MVTELATLTLTADEARALTSEIRQRLDGLLPLIKRAHEGRADRALGYESWQAYCAAELNDVRVPLADRPAMVAELRAAGMSTRAIGSALGVDAKTVRNDLSTGEFSPVDQPERITSLDGRERPATRPPAPEPSAGTDESWPSVATPPVDPDAEDDARRDAELDAALSETATRFRVNFSSARLRAAEITTFDPDRVCEVYGANFDREVGDLLNRLQQWTERVREAQRGRQRAGLRLVIGGDQ